MKLTWMEDFNCPLCGLENLDPNYARAIPYPNLDGEEPTCEPKVLQLLYHECAGCGFRFLNPRPTPDSYLHYYTTMTYRNSCTPTQEVMDRDEQQRADRIVYLLPIEAESHLDVGCSRGYLLKNSRYTSPGRTRLILGVEPNENYTIEGVPTVRDIDDVEGVFDVVTCIHALEHSPDPKYMAKRLVELTRPGGVLIIEVPSETFPGESASLSHPWAFTEPVIKHLFYGMCFEETIQSGKHPVFIMHKESNA